MLERVRFEADETDLQGWSVPDFRDSEPHSGVHFRDDMMLRDVPFVRSEASMEFEDSDDAPSTLRRIAKAIKDSIYPSPTAPKHEVKEVIPQDEQHLMDLLDFDRESIENFSRIIDIREALELNAMAAGMSRFEIERANLDPNCYDSRLDAAITQAWRDRLEEKVRSIAELEIQLQNKRQLRRARVLDFKKGDLVFQDALSAAETDGILA